MDPCPQCGSTDRKQEPGEYALIKLASLELHVDKPATTALVVEATVCKSCANVTLRDVGHTK